MDSDKAVWTFRGRQVRPGSLAITMKDMDL